MSKLINIYQEKFTVIPQEVFIDPRLDFRSRGVLATIVSLPSGWDFSIEGLSRIVAESERGEGRDAVKTSVQFLEKLGYLSRVRTQNEKGHFSGYDYFRFPELYENIQEAELYPFLEQTVTEERCCLSVIEPIGGRV